MIFIRIINMRISTSACGINIDTRKYVFNIFHYAVHYAVSTLLYNSKNGTAG